MQWIMNRWFTIGQASLLIPYTRRSTHHIQAEGHWSIYKIHHYDNNALQIAIDGICWGMLKKIANYLINV